MNRLLVLGLPIAKSVLYERRSIITNSLKRKISRRNTQTMSSLNSPRETIVSSQSSIGPNEG